LVKEQRKSRHWGWSRSVAVILLVFLALVSIYLGLTINEWNKDNVSLQQTRTFNIPFGLSFNNTRLVTPENPDDVDIDLTLTYPKATLVVDDVVTMVGLANLNTVEAQKIAVVLLGFQNCLEYPLNKTNDIPNFMTLHIANSNGTNKLIGETEGMWQLEGQYHASVILAFKNGTVMDAGYSQDVAVTVYPKAQYAQIVTNNVSMALTVGVYLLTVMSTGSLILTLWDREQSTQEGKNNPKPDNCHAEVSDEKGKAELKASE